MRCSVQQNLHDLLEAISFVDKIIFGRTNYSKEVSAYTAHRQFYNDCAREVMDFCTERGIAYHIKEKTITAINEQADEGNIDGPQLQIIT